MSYIKNNKEVIEIIDLLDKYHLVHLEQFKQLVGKKAKPTLDMLEAKNQVKRTGKMYTLNNVFSSSLSREEKYYQKLLWVLCDIKSKNMYHMPTDRYSVLVVAGNKEIEVIYCGYNQENIINAIFSNKNDIHKVIVVDKQEQVENIKVQNLYSFAIANEHERKYFK